MTNLSPLPLEAILRIPLFDRIQQADILPLINSAHEKHLQAGEFFYLQGEPAERLYILIEGRVKRILSGEDGKQTLIQVIKPVNPFGLMAMTTVNVYPVTAEAARESRAIYWNGYDLMTYAMKLPQLALNAMRLMAEQLSEIQERFRQVNTQKVEQRLANTLIRLASQSGKRVKEGILIDHPLTRKDLAEMSGTTVYTASRKISQWHGQELLYAGREKVIIRNPHGLARIIEGIES